MEKPIFRIIFHIDLNAFFASCEIARRPELKDVPVAITGEKSSKRGIVTTANYVARKYGVSSAMPLVQAKRKCPNLVVIAANFNLYKQVSRQFLDLLHTYTDQVEKASIDEAYLDVTALFQEGGVHPVQLALQMQQRIFNELKIGCSVGIGPNKFLAKMASDMRKPMGITVLRKQEITTKLWPLSITEMWGIGKKSHPLLIANGITTIGDLANPENESKIMTLLGKHAYGYIQNARGNDTNVLSFNTTVQSISQSTTLDRDIEDYDEIKTVLRRLAKSLSRRAQNDDLKGRLISVSIRYYDFTNAVRSMSYQEYTNDETVLFEQALYLFDRNHNGKPIRHLGIGLGSLFSRHKSIDQLQMKLAQPVKDSVENVLEQLNAQLPGIHLTTADKKLHHS